MIGSAAGTIAMRVPVAGGTTDRIDAGAVGHAILQSGRTFFAMNDVRIVDYHDVFTEDRLVSCGSPGRAAETGPAQLPDRCIRDCQPQRGSPTDA